MTPAQALGCAAAIVTMLTAIGGCAGTFVWAGAQFGQMQTELGHLRAEVLELHRQHMDTHVHPQPWEAER